MIDDQHQKSVFIIDTPITLIQTRRNITLRTAEVEFMAVAFCVQEVSWVKILSIKFSHAGCRIREAVHKYLKVDRNGKGQLNSSERSLLIFDITLFDSMSEIGV